MAVEVLSPGDRPGRVLEKVADYLAAGTWLVWIVDPARKRVTVHRSLLEPRSLNAEDVLDGDEILPGFRVSIAEIT